MVVGQLELSASVFQAWGLGHVDLGRKQKSSKVSESREKGSELQASGYVYIYIHILSVIDLDLGHGLKQGMLCNKSEVASNASPGGPVEKLAR